MKLKIVIPSGGDGIRFKEKGFKELKPFISFLGKTMFEHLILGFQSEKYNIEFMIIIRDEFKPIYKKQINYLETKYKNLKFYYINKKTEGTTATALNFYDHLNNDNMLLLANCDQIIDVKLDKFISKSKKYDGSLLVFNKEKSPKWSFVKINENGLVERVVAKQPISDLAVCGWYFWKKSSDFIKYGISQIVNQDKVNNEYYLCPVYNFAIEDNKKIFSMIISKDKMHGVGTPEDLEYFLKNIK